tara:strand:+ start:1824 stop:3317 length:1494 start_codon:yes stop_codon:yes gene_type:complete
MIKTYHYFILIFTAYIFAADMPSNINKVFKEPGSIESLITSGIDYDELILVQLDLVEDSLLSVINTDIPQLNLNIGLGTYHRIFPVDQFDRLKEIAPEHTYKILKRPYILPSNSREYWIELKEGSDTHGTYTEDDAISYTCDCANGASNCVKLGWYSWYNPFDYWAEAWWAFSPPEHSSINEIRVVVRGVQCDDLPLWSETYMGMRDENGNWSQDYQLSIDYTDNIYIVPETWSENMLMPIIGSEDNYVVDQITLQFFYTCPSPNIPNYVVASDNNYCDYVNINWDAPEDAQGILGYNLYRDGVLINQFSNNVFNFSDYGADDNTTHEYCVSSINECGESEYSCNDGSLKSSAYPAENIFASDGLYPTSVLIQWDESENAESYKIYRDNIWLGVSDASSDLEYIDYYIDYGIEHNYCIESINDCGNSNLICDLGYGSNGLGDVNEDSSIDVLDIVSLVNIIMGYLEPTTAQLWSSDINNDDMINIQDVVLLVNLILN